MKKLFVLLLIPSLLLAECDNAIRLNVGDVVRDCPRIGLEVNFEKTIREQLAKVEILQAIITEKTNLIEAKSLSLSACVEEKEILKTDDKRERDALDAERSRGKTEFWLGMGVGISVVALAAWVVNKVAR